MLRQLPFIINMNLSRSLSPASAVVGDFSHSPSSYDSRSLPRRTASGGPPPVPPKRTPIPPVLPGDEPTQVQLSS